MPLYRTRLYDVNGILVGGGQGYMPDSLDWMPIEAKAFWFRYMSMGDPRTEYALLESQGEQRLLTGVSLENLDHKSYKEKLNGSEAAVHDFIDREGISRTPRNQ